MTATTAIPEDVPTMGQTTLWGAEGSSGTLTYWLGHQPRQDVLLVVLRYGSNNGRQRRDIVQLVLPRELGPQRVEVQIPLGLGGILGRLVLLDEGIGNVGAAAQETFRLGREVGALLARGGGHRRRGRGHVGLRMSWSLWIVCRARL